MFNEYGISHLDIDVTDECNFACKYCYHHGKKKRHYPLQENIKKKLIETINNEKKINISFMGGEPLFRFNTIQEIVNSVSKKFRWSITSNLSLLNTDKYNYIKENGGKIHPSIDGNKESHDMFRVFKDGSGTYEYIYKKIPFVLKLNRKATARSTIHPDNVHLLYDSIISLAKMGFHNFAAMPIFEANWEDKHWNIYKEQLIKLSKFNLEHPWIHIKNFGDCLRAYNNQGRKPVAGRLCGAGFNLVAVATTGLIYPCHRFTSPILSDWCIGSINSGINKEQIKKYRNSFPIVPEQCKICRVAATCSRGCPAVNWNTNKELNSVNENHCKYMKTGYDIAIAMMDKMSNKKNSYSRKKK